MAAGVITVACSGADANLSLAQTISRGHREPSVSYRIGMSVRDVRTEPMDSAKSVSVSSSKHMWHGKMPENTLRKIIPEVL